MFDRYRIIRPGILALIISVPPGWISQGSWAQNSGPEEVPSRGRWTPSIEGPAPITPPPEEVRKTLEEFKKLLSEAKAKGSENAMKEFRAEWKLRYPPELRQKLQTQLLQESVEMEHLEREKREKFKALEAVSKIPRISRWAQSIAVFLGGGVLGVGAGYIYGLPLGKDIGAIIGRNALALVFGTVGAVGSTVFLEMKHQRIDYEKRSVRFFLRQEADGLRESQQVLKAAADFLTSVSDGPEGAPGTPMSDPLPSLPKERQDVPPAGQEVGPRGADLDEDTLRRVDPDQT